MTKYELCLRVGEKKTIAVGSNFKF